MREQLKEKALDLRTLYHLGQVSLEEIKEPILEYVNEFNSFSKEIAKKYNQKPKLITVNSFLRL